MPARLLLRERKELEEGGFIDLILWKSPSGSTGRPHGYKYRLAYVRDGRCVLRYDNETGKAITDTSARARSRIRLRP